MAVKHRRHRCPTLLRRSLTAAPSRFVVDDAGLRLFSRRCARLRTRVTRSLGGVKMEVMASVSIRTNAVSWASNGEAVAESASAPRIACRDDTGDGAIYTVSFILYIDKRDLSYDNSMLWIGSPP